MYIANITISRQDITTIIVQGNIAATIYNGDIFPLEYVQEDFDTILLDNTSLNSGDRINIEDAVDYDDEVKSNGDIDIGEIAAQFLSLEIY